MAEASRLSLGASLWASSSVGSNMITGIVTASREAIITLTVRGPAGHEQEIQKVRVEEVLSEQRQILGTSQSKT